MTCALALNKMKFRMIKLSILGLYLTFGITMLCLYAHCQYGECHVSFIDHLSSPTNEASLFGEKGK
jgi:hypothetical protein